MGMYDYLKNLKVKCTVCGKNREMDWQTKNFDCELGTYNVGDEVDCDFETITCFGNCPNCGKMHVAEVKIIDGKISDEYKLFTVEEWFGGA